MLPASIALSYTWSAPAAASDLARKQTTAILAYNDQLAIGVIRGLTAMGTVVPDDVSIIGFDNIFAADLVTPRLTTVAAPLQALGGTAVHNLLAIIIGSLYFGPRNVFFTWEFAGLGYTNRIQPTPPTVIALLP